MDAIATAGPVSSPAQSPREQFLETFEREHQTTMKVLRAYPADKADLKFCDNGNSARQVAWMFVLEGGLGAAVLQDQIAKGGLTGKMPPPPERWEEIVAGAEKAHQDFANLVRSYSDGELQQPVKFFVAPKTMGDWKRIAFCWFLLSDEIHHRGQLSVYLRAAGGKVPSIYGPSADEPWM